MNSKDKIYYVFGQGTRACRITMEDPSGEYYVNYKYVVTGRDEIEAIKKVRSKENQEDHIHVDKELTSGKEIPLEKRLGILGEIINVID